MKTFTKSILAFGCLLLVAAKSYAVTPPSNCSFKVGMYPIINTYKMNVMIEKEQMQPLKVTLKDKNQKLLHKQHIMKKVASLSQKIDFSNLEDGIYYLTISDGKSEIVKEIKFNTKEFVEVPYRTLVALN